MWLTRSLLAALLALAIRPVRYADLSAELRARLRPAVAEAAEFDRLRERIARDTAERLRAGDEEAAVYFALQSRTFTTLPPIEPALSAREFAGRGEIPADARARLAGFGRALERPAGDERLRWLQQMPRVDLAAAYERAMRFLQRKEFAAGTAAYASRGFSTDTGIEAQFAVATALDVIRSLDTRARLERVLLIGPGLNFAPRTALRDDLPPQSYQPYLLADALLRRDMADARRLEIACVDINPRVVRFIQEFRGGRLLIPRPTVDAEFEREYREMGRAMGAVRDLPQGKSIAVRKDLRVSATVMNVVTERAPESYDLILATNVLVYFDDTELALALANIAAMLRPGGWFAHNELRPELEIDARAAGLPVLQGRTLRIAQGTKRPLLDAFVLHRKPI